MDDHTLLLCLLACAVGGFCGGWSVRDFLHLLLTRPRVYVVRAEKQTMRQLSDAYVTWAERRRP